MIKTGIYFLKETVVNQKSTWFDEIGWIKGENGKWEWDSLGIYEDYGS